MMKFVAALFLAFCASAFAQPVPPTSTGPVAYPITAVRNVSTVGASSVSAANVGRYAFAVATGGLVVADATTGLPLPDGKNLPVTVRSSIPRATVAGALGRFARKTLPVLSVGVALYDLGQELGFGLDNSSGALHVSYADSSGLVCTSGTCTGYRFADYPSIPAQYTQVDACRLLYLFMKANYPNFTYDTGTPPNQSYSITAGTPQCRVSRLSGSTGASVLTPFITQNLPPQQPVSTPSTVDAFEDAIEANSSWPPSSALARAMKDAINSGELTPIHPHDVTGPATTPGPVTTSTDNVNNTTTTSTTTNNHTYSGPSVTTTTTTTNVTINNTTGAVISSTTVNSQPVMPEQSEEDQGTASDTPLPSIPKLYEPEFPDGLEGVWNDRKAQLLDTSLFQIIPTLMPNVGDGGCPTWSIPSIYGGNLNASIPCNVWYFIRLVIILTALMLARRLIFGG